MQGAGLSSRTAYAHLEFAGGRFDTLSISAASARVGVCKFAEGSTSERPFPVKNGNVSGGALGRGLSKLLGIKYREPNGKQYDLE